ncbi:MAG: hypothetical protein IKE14_01530 [Loktanella sp.]|nr:hypothetical protein [Loktanella sp.]
MSQLKQKVSELERRLAVLESQQLLAHRLEGLK